jgi:D-alanyl-D-alanine carboxypeptidase
MNIQKIILKQMKYISFLILLLLFSLGCRKNRIQTTEPCTFNSSFPINPNHPKAAKLASLMDSYVAKGIPGMTILIHDADGFWIASRGYADLEEGVLMEPCHINKLGSITKMMMGALVWQLVQEGKLNIHAPISQYIPEVATQITNGKDIIVSMLLDHTSGIYDISRDLGYNLGVVNDFTKRWTAEEILAFVGNKPATNLPGEKVSYSNSNTLLEGMIIDKITGQPHGEVLRERIFAPLGMDHTYYYNYAEPFPNQLLAQGYLDFHNDGGSIQNISSMNPGSGNGYTGVYSTVSDLYKFLNALLVEKTLISPENLEYIFNNFKSTGSGTWQTSIGAIHREYMDVLPESVKALGHGGGDIGYSANLNYFPHNQTIYAATFNYGTNLPTELGKELDKLRIELIKTAAE